MLWSMFQQLQVSKALKEVTKNSPFSPNLFLSSLGKLTQMFSAHRIGWDCDNELLLKAK